jgi:diguanylate cyclase (GGDEF)-like protein
VHKVFDGAPDRSRAMTWAMRRSLGTALARYRWIAGPMVIGLGLLSLVSVLAVGSLAARSAAASVRRAVVLNEALHRAALAVSAEESSERKYLLEPGPEARGAHAGAERALAQAMRDIEHSGDPADELLAHDVLRENDGYVNASQALFDARDRDATDAQIEKVDTEQVDPVFGRLEEQVSAAAARHHAQAVLAAGSADRIGTEVVVADLVTLAAGLFAFGLVGRRMLQAQRRLQWQSEHNAHQATHDSLTGLPNRTLLNDRAGHALALAERQGGQVAMLLMDLDRFKEINDTLGHHAGDQLLVLVAERLKGTVRASDTVARLGGDEFAVLVEGATQDSAVETADRLTTALRETFQIGGVSLDIEASIGIALSQGDQDDVTGLLQRADIAMYQAKESHQSHALYDAELDVNTPARLTLLGDLRRALQTADQLRLEYQPKISTNTGEVYGVEALLRWDHPVRGPIPPASFIPVVETTGLIDELTFHVLRLALAQQSRWVGQGIELPVAVNISARSLLDPRFPERVEQILAQQGLPARSLILELTETSMMVNPDAAVAILTRLAEQGIRLSIDDFGTGYSSMSYLKRLPVSELKIDRSFVMDLPRNEDNAVLIQSAVDLGHNLGLNVVAEGVEDEATLQRLREMGCDLAQGYHISRPASPEALHAWIQANVLTPDHRDSSTP